ncbi:MAG: type IV pilus assembly protein PilM [Planctomycetes bacterium]|nr:type IV pilus assembly protein PilM [Planctomycetota bacterium]
MATATAAWGIDIGRCAFKALKLRPGTDGKVEAVGHEYIEHAKILSQPDADRSALIVAALERFLSRNDISKDKIVVSVPGQHTLARFSKLPPVEPKKIPDIVRYEAAQQIPFDLDEVIWDYQTFQQEDSPDLEVGIFAMKRELIRDYLLPFQQVSIEPIAVQSAPLALYNAMCFDQRIDETASVLLDIGVNNTDLIVATKDNLWTRTIPLGGNHFTEALVKSFKLSFSKAEKLKRTAATSKYARQVFQSMRPVFADLVQELSRSLGFYRSTHRDTELARIIGMGNAFELPGLQKYLQQNLQLPVERPAGLKMLTVGDIRDESVFKENMSSYAVAYGLALQGLELAGSLANATAVHSNLLPPEIVRQVIWRKKKPFFAAAAACLLLASGIVWFRQMTDMTTLADGAGDPVGKISVEQAGRYVVQQSVPFKGLREEGEKWLTVAQTLKKEYDQYNNLGSDEQEKIEQLIRLQRNKAVWPRILAAIHAALPELPPELADVETADDYLAAVRKNSTGKLARRKRPELFIKEFSATYFEEVDQVDLLDMITGDSGEDVLKPAKDGPQNGFLVSLLCRTPNERQIRFVTDFMRALRTQGRQPEQGFYINRVVMIDGWAFTEKPKGGGRPPGRGGRGGSGGKGRSRGGGGQPSSPPATGNKLYDPVTDESMKDDWFFRLQLDVVLADLPEPETDEKES